MEIIRSKIMKILPSLQSNILDSLIKILQDIGVAAEDDLKYVQESDLTTVLRPIQARKLIDVWKQLDSVPTVSTPVTNTTSTASHILASGSDSSESTPVTLQSIPIDWAEDYAIPWQSMPEELLKDLKEGRRPTPSGRREFINITAQSIYKICPKPGKKNLTGGCESLTRSFVVKFENLNRRDAFSSVKRKLKQAEKDDSNNDRQLSASSKYGCLNWQPKILPIGESSESQIEKQNEMIQISSIMKPGDELNEQSLTLLETTYYSQRKDINNLKNVSFLLNNWPLLFSEKGFFLSFLHFNWGDDSVATSYMVAVDKKIINEEIKSFETGFFMVFAAYYIVNIEYAEMAGATLEFIQRCFLRMNPDKGSKASRNKKKKCAMNQKVLSLLNKLMDFEWC
ncbi:hypothetical protein AVEN_128782-1 [Araneus ventricosus]|uniref:Uncharacterized protein n=1 Tax=Araneus ventricosus TaxID=182803 RepID=A0A4Y2RM29_ARAVE|nr:hypothetical protein AVEN_128782-1 [Araneus ventricosus]